MLERLLALDYGVQWAIISRELHQDGESHIHVAVQFKKRIFARDLNAIFDKVGGKHGHYLAMKSIPGAIAYCKKEDPDPLLHGKLPATKNQKKSDGVMNKIAQGLLEGKPIQSFVAEHGGIVMLHLQKMKTFQAMIHAHGQPRLTLTNQMTLTFGQTGEEAERHVHEWLRLNLLDRSRPHKQHQLYLQAPTNHNKTSLVLLLGKYFKYYVMPLHENFDDSYEDELYDFVVLDEFSHKIARTVQMINAFVEGAQCTLRTKGGQVIKKVNLPVIILSNYPPSLFWNQEDIHLFNSRFTHVTLTSPLDLDLIQIQSTPITA